MPKQRRVALAIDLRYPLRHHYDVFAGTQTYARERANWNCVVQPFIGLLRRGGDLAGYQGIIARASPELVRHAARARVPLVNIWSTTAAGTMPSVLPDFAACGHLAAAHLLHRGFRQFAFHGFTRHRASSLAWAGFRAALRTEKRIATKHCVPAQCDENARSWSKYTADLQRWMTQWELPLGVLVTQDILGRYVANACLNAGLRVPDDVAIISLGNEPLICTQPEPSLSSFDLNYERVGYEAAALLERLMDGKAAPRVPTLVQPAKLAVRSSTDAYAVEDSTVTAALRYMSEHSHTPLRVPDVARHVHTSVRSLERRFHTQLGRTISQELIRLRIDRAKRLLVEGDQRVKNVAYQCGFSSVKHFHKMFQAAEGLTPGEFRRQS